MTIANRAQHQLRASSHAITPAGRFNIFVHGIAAEAEDLADLPVAFALRDERSEEHTSELQSLMRISYAVFCLKKKKKINQKSNKHSIQTRTHQLSHYKNNT